MVSVNLIFHIVSALTFVVLIWWLLHLQTQLTFLRELMGSLSSAQHKVKVDWPDAFLKRFADVQGIPFEFSGTRLPPQKIELKLWAELSSSLGLEAIEWSNDRCRLTVKRDNERDAWRKRIEDSLQGKINIELVFANSKGK